MLYYIAIHDAGRSALIAGPYATEREAESQMAPVRQLAEAADPWSWFYTYSLARSEVRYKTRFGAAAASAPSAQTVPLKRLQTSAIPDLQLP